MRRFELIDGEARGNRPCANIAYDEATGAYSAHIESWAGPGDVPAVFAAFVARGERDIPREWVRAWVDERIAPPSRQNIGEVLKAHGLMEYDSGALLASSEGRSSQDGFYLREVGAPAKGARHLGALVEKERLAVGKTQAELARQSGMTQTAVSVLERGGGNPTLKTLERIADALGKTLVIAFE